MGTFINLPPTGGSLYFGDPVANAGGLPLTGLTGEIRLTLDTGELYYWTGSAWALATPISGMSFKGVWNAATNSPTLADGTGDTGDFYRVNVAGTQNLGSGAQTFVVGDYVLYDGTVWRLGHSGADAVITVNGQTGAVSLDLTDLVAETAGGSASMGQLGEILSASQSSATGTGVAATGVFGNATSLSVTAGVWRLMGVAGFKENGSVLTTSLSCGISNSPSGASLTDLDVAVHNNLVSSTSDLVVPCLDQLISIGSTTTYYLNTRFFYTSGSPQHYGKLTALRIR